MSEFISYISHNTAQVEQESVKIDRPNLAYEKTMETI